MAVPSVPIYLWIGFADDNEPTKLSDTAQSFE